MNSTMGICAGPALAQGTAPQVQPHMPRGRPKDVVEDHAGARYSSADSCRRTGRPRVMHVADAKEKKPHRAAKGGAREGRAWSRDRTATSSTTMWPEIGATPIIFDGRDRRWPGAAVSVMATVGLAITPSGGEGQRTPQAESRPRCPPFRARRESTTERKKLDKVRPVHRRHPRFAGQPGRG